MTPSGSSVVGQMESPASIEEPVSTVMLAGSIHHSSYVMDGAEAQLLDAEKPSLGGLLIVVDGDGWATAHRVAGIYRRGGVRTVKFGPRVPWPDGAIAARSLAKLAPEIEAERLAEKAKRDAACTG